MNTLIRSIFVLCIILLSIPNLLAKADPTLKDIINNWDSADASAGFELGEKISYIYVNNSIDFYRRMYQNKMIFNEWLEKLQHHTFTVYDYKRKKDSCKKENELLNLKGKMLITAKKYLKNKKYYNMSAEIINYLNKISVRFID